MKWLLGNLPLLAFVIAIAAALATLLSILPVFGLIARHSTVDTWAATWTLVWVALKLAAIGVAYGIFLRLLALCDDVAALRRAKTGTPSALD